MKQIQFIKSSHDGWYFVTYTTQKGDYWKASINDMTLIDMVKNSNNPTRESYYKLIKVIKEKGTHYRKNGEPIFYKL